MIERFVNGLDLEYHPRSPAVRRVVNGLVSVGSKVTQINRIYFNQFIFLRPRQNRLIAIVRYDLGENGDDVEFHKKNELNPSVPYDLSKVSSFSVEIPTSLMMAPSVPRGIS